MRGQDIIDTSLLVNAAATEAELSGVAGVARAIRRRPRRIARALARYIRSVATNETSITPLEDIAAQLGASIRREALPFSDGSLTRRGQGIYLIRVHASMAPCRQRFTIAHELGHLVLDKLALSLHGRSSDDSVGLFQGPVSTGARTEELFCQWFAAHLLIPKSVSHEFSSWDNISIERLAERSLQFNICLDVMMRHALEQAHPHGSVLKFLAKSLDRNSRCIDSDAFDLVLVDWFSPSLKLKLIEPYLTENKVPNETQLYRTVERLFPLIRRDSHVSERLLTNLDLSPVMQESKQAVLLKPIRRFVWVLILPDDLDVKSIPVQQSPESNDAPALKQLRLF